MEPTDTRAIWNANASAWIELSRKGYDVQRDLVNTPAFLAMLPPLGGLRCLDVGCGDGHHSRLLSDAGADVVALDISEPFIDAASGADGGRGIRYVLADGLTLPFPTARFDAVTAVMSLMDLADPEEALREIGRVVRPGGFVQFSISHPVIGTPRHRWLDDDSGARSALALGGYFYEGPVNMSWIFSTVPAEERSRHRPFEITHARRTLSGWLNAVIAAGLTIEAVDEPYADRQQAADEPAVADTRSAPYFLLVRARRDADQRPEESEQSSAV